MGTVNIEVGTNTKNPSHYLSLAGGGTTIGIRPTGEQKGVQENPYEASSLKTFQGAGKYADLELPYAYIMQQDFSGGRGQKDLTRDATKYYDSYHAFTIGEDFVVAAPQWRYAINSGRTMYYNLIGEGNDGDMNWVALDGTAQYIAQEIGTGSQIAAADHCRFWIRRVGTPTGTLTVELRAYNAGDPEGGAVQRTVTKTTSDIGDVVSQWFKFQFGSTFDKVGATKYWLVIYDAGTATDTDHWEVGYDIVTSGATHQTSAADTGYSNSIYGLYYQLTHVDAQHSWKFFRYKQGSYALRNIETHGAPSLLTMGDRGVADSGSTRTQLDDSTKSGTWVTNRFVGDWVYVFNGTGGGEFAKITSNTTTALILKSPGFSEALDNTTEYVLLGSAYFHTSAISTHGLTKFVTDIEPLENVTYFAMGDAADMRHMYADETANAFNVAYADSSSIKADYLHGFLAKGGDAEMWRLTLVDGSLQLLRGDATGAAITSWDTAIELSDFEFPTNLVDYNGKIWAFTNRSAYYVINDLVTKFNLGLESSDYPTNGIAVLIQNLYMYFSWSHSLERFYGQNLDDIGPWGGSGMPSGRTGVIADMVGIPGYIFAALDAGLDGTSSVLCWNGNGWHEIFRAYDVGRRINSLYWESIPGGRNRLWVGCGDDAIFMEFPLHTMHPAHDPTYRYYHEAYVITSWIDAGYAELKKYLKEVRIRADGLGASTPVVVDYQVDDNTDLSAWTNAGSATTSPSTAVSVNVGDKVRFRFRIRLLSNLGTTGVELVAAVAKLFVRKPVNYQYTISFHVGDNEQTYLNQPDHGYAETLNQLETWSESATPLTMASGDPRLDGKTVIVEPPGNIVRKSWNRLKLWLTGTATVTIREV